jgi:signal transduction histidine kinase
MEMLLVKIDSSINFIRNIEYVIDSLKRQTDLIYYYAEILKGVNGKKLSIENLRSRFIPLIESMIEDTGLEYSIEIRNEIITNIDPVLFDNMIINLIKNSKEASEGKGKISLIVEQCPGDIIPVDFDRRPENCCKITIIDEGPGISYNDIDIIFTPYFTTKRNGRGLGLYSVINTLKILGGFISFNMACPKGTEISLYVPIDINQKQEYMHDYKNTEQRGNLRVN